MQLLSHLLFFALRHQSQKLPSLQHRRAVVEAVFPTNGQPHHGHEPLRQPREQFCQGRLDLRFERLHPKEVGAGVTREGEFRRYGERGTLRCGRPE